MTVNVKDLLVQEGGTGNGLFLYLAREGRKRKHALRCKMLYLQTNKKNVRFVRESFSVLCLFSRLPRQYFSISGLEAKTPPIPFCLELFSPLEFMSSEMSRQNANKTSGSLDCTIP